MTFPSAKPQKAMGVSFTLQALALHHLVAVMLAHQLLAQTARMQPNNPHPSLLSLG